MSYFYFFLDLYLFATLYPRGEKTLAILLFCAAIVQGLVILRGMKK